MTDSVDSSIGGIVTPWLSEPLLNLERMSCLWMSESYQGDFLWQFWQFWQFWTILDKYDNFSKILNFFTIWQFLTILTFFTIWKLASVLSFEIQRCFCSTWWKKSIWLLERWCSAFCRVKSLCTQTINHQQMWRASNPAFEIGQFQKVPPESTILFVAIMSGFNQKKNTTRIWALYKLYVFLWFVHFVAIYA